MKIERELKKYYEFKINIKGEVSTMEKSKKD